MADSLVEGQHQLVYVRARALKEAVRWYRVPGQRPSDVVATAVWFEDFLLNGEDYTHPEDHPEDRVDEPYGEDGAP